MRTLIAIVILMGGPCVSILAAVYGAGWLIGLPIALRLIDEEAA